MKYTLFVTLSLFFIFQYASAQIYSFEDGLIPTGFSKSLGTTLSVSSTKYKLGTKSLQWNWTGGSVFTCANPIGLSAASTTSGGGILLWIYNTVPSSQPLVFVFKNSTGTQKCSLNFNLNFKGWRCFTACFAADMKHDKSSLATMSVQAPSSGSGVLNFDYLTFSTSVDWARMSDSQYTVSQSPLMSNYLTAYGNNFTPVATPTKAQIDGADSVSLRLDNWHLGTIAYSKNPLVVSRANSLKGWLRRANTYYVGLNLSTQVADGTILGPGLFSQQFPTTIDGLSVRQFGNVNGDCLIPLALDFRKNGTASSKTNLINLYDYMYDQGWAAGSSLSSLYFENISYSVGYTHSLFLMRNALDAKRLQRELDMLKWFSLSGETISPMVVLSQRGVDNMRSILIAKFVYALMQTDPKIKVAALSALSDYCNQVFLPSPGFWDNFKSDYSGYAHGGPYLSSYYGSALYMACFSYYLLHNTPYALSEAVFSQLKNSLLTYRTIASFYNLPQSVNGRFPSTATYGMDMIPAFAYLALSRPTPDRELLAAFGRLWQPANPLLTAAIARTTTDITFKDAVGETELCLKAAALAVPAEPAITKQLYLPYSGLLINRNAQYHVSVKGFSKYIWDYESGLPSNNLYGRYLSYGHIEYTSLADGRKNDAIDSLVWDWSRIPGTTVEHLDSASLVYLGSATPYRNFSDSPFLGGIAFNDTTSLISMKLHTKAFDPSFYALKSVFCFGNVLFCLGSNISNGSSTSQTETTLFQQGLKPGEQIKVNNLIQTASQSGFVKPTLQDNLGNYYIVTNGTVDLVSKGSVVTAYLNHGLKPVNQTYGYFMLLKSNSAQLAKYSSTATNPIQIIRKDGFAHIVQQTEQKVFAYSIFDTNVPLNDSYIQQVNSPSLVMIQLLDSGTLKLTVSDPDMRRTTGASTDALLAVGTVDSGLDFNYQISLKGFYALEGVQQGVTLTYTAGKTTLSFPVREGRSYPVSLKVTTLTDSIILSAKNEATFGIVKRGLEALVKGDFEVYTLSGHLKRKCNLEIGQILDLPAGPYIVKTITASGVTVRKVMV